MARIKLKQITKIVMCVGILGASLFLYQNCGSGFESINDQNYADQSSLQPQINLMQVPAELVNKRDIEVRFEISANAYANIKEVKCQLNDEAPQSCTNVFSAQNLSDGDYILRIRATDSFNNVSNEKIVLWRVDATAPSVSINLAPPEVTGESNTTIEFTAADNLSGLDATECALDGASYTACSSPMQLNMLTEKLYTFRIRARDRAGNMSSEVIRSWRVDRTAPILKIVSGPENLTNSNSATFTFEGIDEGTTLTQFECQLDNNNFEPCSSPRTYNNVANGQRTFRLRARDAAGNLSSTLSHQWVVDRMAPTVTIASTPQNPTNQTTATFQFTPNDGNGSGIKRTECSFDNGGFNECTSPHTMSNLMNGQRRFSVRSVDNAGNVSAVATFTWVIDTVKPQITIPSSVSTTTTSNSVTFTLNATDAGGSNIKSTECRLDSEAFTVCGNSKSYSNLNSGPHIFTARVTDGANNQNSTSFSWQVVAEEAQPTPTPAPPPSLPEPDGLRYVLDDFETGKRRIVQPSTSAEQKYMWFLYSGSGPTTIVSNEKRGGNFALKNTLLGGSEWQFHAYSYTEGLSGWPNGWNYLWRFVNNPNMIRNGSQPAWQLNRINRLRFWIKLPPGFNYANPNKNMEFGTFLSRQEGQHETENMHYYHFYDLRSHGQWEQIIVDMHPDHQRGNSGNTELRDAPQVAKAGYNYFDMMTGFYIDFPGSARPGDYYMDDFEFYEDTNPEKTAQIRSLHGAYIPSTNGIEVGWRRPKTEAGIRHEVRYAFSSVHKLGWANATPAPNGIVNDKGDNAYNGMRWSTTEIDVSGRNLIYIAIKPQNSNMIREIAIPITRP